MSGDSWVVGEDEEPGQKGPHRFQAARASSDASRRAIPASDGDHRTRGPAHRATEHTGDPCVPDSPSDLDCPDIGKKVRVVGPDEHRLDANRDGWGCESYG
ncbi:MAG TPA: hypothetical protein VHS32_15135 [Streptosporangiaceae bacterium]|nr:hypothetical protein [Streptosporangiaceae bacterium]